MSIKTKSHSRVWTQGDVALLKTLLDQGKTTKQIAKLMKRTEPAIHVRKNMLGLHSSNSSKVSKKVNAGNELGGPSKVSVKREAKDLTVIARQIARKNGKRITMAMFFVEDL